MEHKDAVRRKFLKAKEEYQKLEKEMDQIVEDEGEGMKLMDGELVTARSGIGIKAEHVRDPREDFFRLKNEEIPRLVKFLKKVAAKNGVPIT